MKKNKQNRQSEGPITKGIKALLDEGHIISVSPGLTTNNVEKAANELRFDMLPLDLIDPDPNQPRTIFKDEEMEELMDSIRDRGVLQPILVRPRGDRYLIVCGERRYRACQKLRSMFETNNGIPATIRNMSDEEAFEIQIIENLQRKDIEPMEEAVAYKSIVDSRQLSIEDLAVKVAKSKKYVAQRITLAQLIPDFQEMLAEKALTLADAFKLSRLSAEFQADILQFHLKYVDNWREKQDFKFVEFDHYISNQLCRLDKAKFDTASNALPPTACTKCPFNSANQPLLFADMNEPTCSRPACFANKTELAFLEKVNAAEQPDGSPTILFDTGWHEASTKALAKQYEPKGIKVVGTAGYDYFQKPDHPGTFEEYFDKGYYGEDGEDEARKDYDQEIAEYEEEHAQYEAEISDPGIVRALIASGTDRGEVIYIKPKSPVIMGAEAAPKHSKPKPSKATLLCDALKSADLTKISGTRSDKLLALLFGWKALAYIAKEKILSDKFGVKNNQFDFESNHGPELLDKLQELSLEDWKVYERLSLLSSNVTEGSASMAVIEALAQDAKIKIEEPEQTED